MKPLLITCLAGLLVVGCSDANVGDPVVDVSDTDADMNEAMETARKTFDKFLANWQLPNDGTSIKVGVTADDGGIEHIWFSPTKITDTEFTGTCDNNPVNVAGLRIGDSRTFKRSDISDWMIRFDNQCYGGYTIRVLVKMQPDKAPPIVFKDFE